jgi:hypothetical protein
MPIAFATAFVRVKPDMRTFGKETEQGVQKAGLGQQGTKHGRLFGLE